MTKHVEVEFELEDSTLEIIDRIADNNNISRDEATEVIIRLAQKLPQGLVHMHLWMDKYS